MKKLFLFSTLFLIHQNALASADDVCIEKISYGLSPDGVCKTFETPCEIPDEWKQVPSCDLIESDKKSPSMEDTMYRRMQKRNQSYAQKRRETTQARQEEKKKVSGKFKRQGRGYLTRTGNYRKTRLSERKATNYSKRRTFNTKKYNKTTREKMKKLNVSKGGYQHDGDLTKEERQERRQSRPKIQSGTRMNRRGYLSNQPKFSTSVKTRRDSTKMGSQRYWKSVKHENRKRKNSSQRTVKLRKTFRGDRLEGDLENGSLD